MANAPISTVSFHGASLSVTSVDGVPHVALKPICDALSIDVEGQRARIKRHPVLSTCTSVTKVQLPGDTQAREVVLLPLDKLNGWLFGISAARVRDPARRERLVQYQRECFNVLAAHFGVKPATLPPASLPNTPSPERIVLAASSFAGYLQVEIAKALMAGTWKDFQSDRYMITVTHYDERGWQPFIKRLDEGALCVNWDGLVRLLSEPGAWRPTDVQLADMMVVLAAMQAQRANRRAVQPRPAHRALADNRQQS